MRSNKRLILVLFILLIFSSAYLTGCSESNVDAAGAVPEKKDDYGEYIHSALQAVNEKPQEESADATDENVKVVKLTDGSDSVIVSADENLPEDSGVIPDFSATPVVDPEEESDVPEETPTPTPEPTPSGTPDTFDVGTCCIYIKCEEDSSYGSDVIKAINEARTSLGYPELVENEGLSTCANRRTREVAAKFSHTRPNNQPYYSLAPQYFKAEMLAKDNSKAEETFDAWMTDPVARNLIFTTKYGSIGAYCIKCNGLYCVVVAFGD